jgi:hypothetical protein
VGYSTGRSKIVDSLVNQRFLKASKYKNGFNVDPGCLKALVALTCQFFPP